MIATKLIPVVILFSGLHIIPLESRILSHIINVIANADVFPDSDDGGDSPGTEIGPNDNIASGLCASLEGCKTPHKECFKGTSTTCEKCYHLKPVNKRNIMRADFYVYDEKKIRDCLFISSCFPTFNYMAISRKLQYMLRSLVLKGTSVADRFQGALFQDINVPEFANLATSYDQVFCDASCAVQLRKACTSEGTLKNVKDWCLTILDWISEDIPKLTGPTSYVLMLAAKMVERRSSEPFPTPIKCKEKTEDDLTDCDWDNFVPPEFDWDGVEGALVTAALTASMMTSTWYDGLNRYKGIVGEFGFTVQHSLWLAIFSGRLAIKVMSKEDINEAGFGNKILCDLQDAENHELETGSVYASICVLLNRKKGAVFRPVIRGGHSAGCVEKSVGMVYVRPGDWAYYRLPIFMEATGKPDCIGSDLGKHGVAFVDNRNMLTTVELTRQGVTLFPPSIGESLKDSEFYVCKYAEDGNGHDRNGLLAECGITRVGGICKWIHTW